MKTSRCTTPATAARQGGHLRRTPPACARPALSLAVLAAALVYCSTAAADDGGGCVDPTDDGLDPYVVVVGGDVL